MLVVRTTEGDVGILKGHTDYVASLDIGIIKIKKDGVFKEATIAGGFIQVDKEKTTILTEAAEWPTEIDVERANKAKDLAETIITRKISDIEMDMAEIRLKENESLESALRRFKKQCARAGVIAEVRKREAYEKPSVKRKKKSEAARKRKYR